MSNTIPADVQFALDILERAGNVDYVAIKEPGQRAKPFDLDAMIDASAGKLGVTPAKKDTVEAADPETITELWTKAEELKKVEDRAKRDRAKITALLKQTTPEGKVLTVHGAPVFANTIVASRVLDQAAVKNEFPDIAGNERFYKDSLTTRADYKR
jgi:hypothetical protein